MNNLALRYVNRDKFTEAESLYLECVRKWQVASENTHHDSLRSRNKWTNFYCLQGKSLLLDQLRSDIQREQLYAYSIYSFNEIAKGGIDRLVSTAMASQSSKIFSENASSLCVGHYGRKFIVLSPLFELIIIIIIVYKTLILLVSIIIIFEAIPGLD